MNKIVTLALSSMLALSPLVGVAQAEEATKVPAAEMVTADSISVINIGSMEGDKSVATDYSRLQTKMANPAEMEKTQVELKNDPALEAALTAQNVQLNNVVEILKAADGSRIIYVK